MEEIRDAARTACVDDAIMGFPDGYETMVGERGVTLSGGQRQRIAIARMLLAKTPIMVFDDSLSAVDAETDADQILVLNHGRAEELGTHQELIRNGKIYQKIYEIQMNQDDRRLLEEGGTADERERNGK